MPRVKEAKLPRAHEKSDADDRLPADVRLADKEDAGEDHQHEADGHEQQRRDVCGCTVAAEAAARVQTEVDRDEIQAP
ncbi:hypothetical protein [Arthrobacter sp. NA-172]|uniref:hypothetical protein n=1 Tax=Arthrobacter sp. NA-172 TaxID=3367524 RepID=UPI00375406D5